MSSQADSNLQVQQHQPLEQTGIPAAPEPEEHIKGIYSWWKQHRKTHAAPDASCIYSMGTNTNSKILVLRRAF